MRSDQTVHHIDKGGLGGHNITRLLQPKEVELDESARAYRAVCNGISRLAQA